MSPSRAAAAVLLVLGLSACTDGGELVLPDAEVRYRTEYVDVAPLGAAPMCGGTLALIDAQVEHLLDVLGLELSRRLLLHYIDPGLPAPDPWCDEWLGVGRYDGCYLSAPDAIFTTYRAITHELTHAVTFERGGSWWSEGIARGFAAVELEYSTGWSDRRGYSGHLARWLVERHGGPTFMDLYDRTPPGADQAEVEAAVRDVLGVEFDDLLDEYAATAPSAYPDFWGCWVPPDTPVLDGHYWERELDLDCERDDTFSTDDFTRSRMTARLPLTLPGTAPYRFFVDHPDAELYLRPCPSEPRLEPDPDERDWSQPLSNTQILSASTFPAGSYILLVSVPAGAPTTVRVTGYLAVE